MNPGSGKAGHSALLSGAVWMIAMRWTMRVLGLASTVVVARILAPEDFGVVAVALIVIGFLETIAYLGVDLALIRDSAADRDAFDTAWTIQVGQGVLIAVLLWLSAIPVASYFNEPRAAAVIGWLALRPIIDGLQNIGLVTFRKTLDFAAEFRFNVVVKITGVAIQIGAALALRNYWAIVVGMLAATVVSTAMSYALHPYRPRPCLRRLSGIFSFSQWLLVARLGTYFARSFDELVVGRLAGTEAMGGYHVARNLAAVPTTEIVMPMRRALFPALSSLAADSAEYRRNLLHSLSAVVALCAALGVGLACAADLVVPLVLGDKWLETIPLLRWLAVVGVVNSVLTILEIPLWVSGRTRLSAALSWAELALAVPVLYFTTSTWGAEGAAAGRLAISLVMLPFAIALTRSVSRIGWGDLARAVIRPLLAGAALALAMTVVAPAGWPAIVTLAAKLLVGAMAYVAALYGLWAAAGRPDGFEARMLRWARSHMHRRPSSNPPG